MYAFLTSKVTQAKKMIKRFSFYNGIIEFKKTLVIFFFPRHNMVPFPIEYNYCLRQLNMKYTLCTLMKGIIESCCRAFS